MAIIGNNEGKPWGRAKVLILLQMFGSPRHTQKRKPFWRVFESLNSPRC